MIKWGAHLSKQGSYQGVLEQAIGFGINALQVFPHSPFSYFMDKGHSEAEVIAFGHAAQEKGITAIFHSCFMVNLASPKANIYAVTKKSIIEDLKLAEKAGIPYVVTHIGSHTGDSDFEMGKKRVVDALSYIISVVKPIDTILLLENSAGGGTSMGPSIENCFSYVKATSPDIQKHLGVCVDTAHAYGAGYDLARKEVRDSILMAGVGVIKLIHLNNPDSTVRLGSHLDRHRCAFSEGALSEKSMKDIYDSFKQYTMILERPNESTKGDHQDLRVLRADSAAMLAWIKQDEEISNGGGEKVVPKEGV